MDRTPLGAVRSCRPEHPGPHAHIFVELLTTAAHTDLGLPSRRPRRTAKMVLDCHRGLLPRQHHQMSVFDNRARRDAKHRAGECPNADVERAPRLAAILSFSAHMN